MIRTVEPRDAEGLARIYNHYIEHTIITFEEEPLSAAQMLQRAEKVLAAGLPWLVCEEQGQLAGYAYAGHWKERAAYRHTAESSVYLDTTHLRRGYGTALYTALFESLADSGIHVVIGGVALPNAASVALHEKMGMRKVAHFHESGFKFGRWIDVGYWQLTFRSREGDAPASAAAS